MIEWDSESPQSHSLLLHCSYLKHNGETQRHKVGLQWLAVEGSHNTHAILERLSLHDDKSNKPHTSIFGLSRTIALSQSQTVRSPPLLDSKIPAIKATCEQPLKDKAEAYLPVGVDKKFA